MTRGLALRVASGVVAIPLLIGTALIGGIEPAGWIVYCGVIILASGLAAFELRSMLRQGRFDPIDVVLIGLTLALPLDVALREAGPGSNAGSVVTPDGMLLITLAVLVGLVVLVLRGDAEHGMVDWALSVALALYVGGLMQFYLPLRRLPDGGLWVVSLLVLSWVCDSCAYFVGRAFGRRRLAPRISPSKSVEGAAAGLAGAALVGAIIGLVVDHGAGLMAGYGLAIGVATVIGDLAESGLKRQTGVKDSGVLIPGHGGILDRMDSLLFCAPIAYAYVLAFG
ncbi:MAG: phosphatidate cytidylyltransferase [Chloroflexi bacterium]|nr:phosphatidate cytidylyltransferase [Chloroflexota bacterium]